MHSHVYHVSDHLCERVLPALGLNELAYRWILFSQVLGVYLRGYGKSYIQSRFLCFAKQTPQSMYNFFQTTDDVCGSECKKLGNGILIKPYIKLVNGGKGNNYFISSNFFFGQFNRTTICMRTEKCMYFIRTNSRLLRCLCEDTKLMT